MAALCPVRTQAPPENPARHLATAPRQIRGEASTRSPSIRLRSAQGRQVQVGPSRATDARPLPRRRPGQMLTRQAALGAPDRDVEAASQTSSKLARSPKRASTVTCATKRGSGGEPARDGGENEPVLSGKQEPDQETESILPSWLGGGVLALITVAFLWGTYTPVLRFVYAIDGAPSPSMLTATRGVLGSLVLGITSLIFSNRITKDSKALGPHCRKTSILNTSEFEAAVQDAVEEAAAEQERQKGFRGWLEQKMKMTFDRLSLAGAEMGFWNFMGTALQAIGLEYTTATRAAFIIQSTALFTPLISSLAGERLTQTTWMGCMAAMMGTLLVTAEHTGDPMHQAMASGSWMGDVCVLGSAFFYACTTVRLGMYANKFPAVDLAAAKTMMLCIISLGWLAVEIFEGMAAGGTFMAALLGRWQNYTSVTLWIWVLFSALGPGALAAYLQTVGQSSCTPSQAQIIFSSVPIWSALLAVVVLKEQPMGLVGWAGGAFIIAGGMFATGNQDEKS